MFYRLSFRSFYLKSFCFSNSRLFCSSKNDSSKLNKLKEKLNQDNSANSPIGMMNRLPKKDKNVEAKNKTDQLQQDPYAPFPDNINPKTGEKNGPKGSEPTRYGDWERKGRVSDF